MFLSSAVYGIVIDDNESNPPNAVASGLAASASSDPYPAKPNNSNNLI